MFKPVLLKNGAGFFLLIEELFFNDLAIFYFIHTNLFHFLRPISFGLALEVIKWL
jgi:hypothetical protein